MPKPSPKAPPPTDDARKRLMRAILAACRRLGIESDDRKAVQTEITSKASMALMTKAELGKLLDHFNRGWKPEGDRPHIGKIKALWWTLYWIGEVDDPNEKALSAFVKRQTGISSLRFVDHKAAPAVIEALKDWAARLGLDWIKGGCDRWPVITWLELKLVNSRESRGQDFPILARQGLDLPVGAHHWTDRQKDEAIRFLGKQWRRHLGKKNAD